MEYHSTNPSSQPTPVTADPFLLQLVTAGFLQPAEMAEVASEAQKTQLTPLAYLAHSRKINTKTLALQLAKYLSLPYLDLQQSPIDPLADNVLDASFVLQQQLLPLHIKDNHLHLAIAEPAQLAALSEVKFYTDFHLQAVVVEWDKLKQRLDDFRSRQQYASFHRFQAHHPETDDQVIHFAQELLIDAIKKRASDIHLEPYKTSYRIRQRIDGLLHKITSVPLELAQRLTARLKIMGKLDVSERRLPQDGRFSLEVSPHNHRDCRISTCPTLHGEKTVVRILESDQVALQSDELGMAAEQLRLFHQAIHKPHGMILVTGPTGSGKTLTLYTALTALNTLEKNISTVEDPVEIQLAGVNQVHVNLKADLTFSKILRAFLRQDPDIIMVGEIRDLETVDIALKAAQTGHLVLATLHTNSAAETINRLLLMGVSAFNMAQSVHTIIAQRLLRKLCEYCKTKTSIDPELIANLGFSTKNDCQPSFYNAQGCDRCVKGYYGRTGVFEFLAIDSELANAIIQGASHLQIMAMAKKCGMVDLRTAAFDKVCAGITTLEEIQRVIL